jgi:prevent-host-death family protein
MSTVSIPEAKTQLSELIDLAQQGEDTIIVREGKPVARLSGLDAGNKTIRYGALKDTIWIAEDFDEPLSEDFLLRSGF